MKLPVNLDVQATAKAEISITGEIPKKTVGRLFEALADVFSPFTEARGLRGDQIRLQREDVAIEIAKRAKARLEIDHQQAKPVDNKILIPFIEKSSLEDISDDDMLDRWSALLANATTSSKVQPRFIQILSEITKTQAALFEEIMFNDTEKFKNPDSIFEDVPLTLNEGQLIRDIRVYLKNTENLNDLNSIHSRLVLLLDIPGCAIIDVIVMSDSDFISAELEKYHIKRYDNLEIDLEVLGSLGLLKNSTIHIETDNMEDISLYYYHVTELGISFLRSVDRRSRILTSP